MRARVVWAGRGLRFQGRTEGKPWVAVHVPEKNENPEGSSPMDLFLIGAMACSASDVVDILRKGRHKVESLAVEGEAQRAKTDPRVYTRVHYTYRVRGAVPEKALRRAVDLSLEKYCSASIMLRRAGASVTSEIHVEPSKS